MCEVFVEVNNVYQLRSAISSRKKILITDEKLAKKIKLLFAKQSRYNTPIDSNLGAASLACLAGIPVAVAITLIITLGIVAIVGMTKDYRMIIDDGRVVLDPKN